MRDSGGDKGRSYQYGEAGFVIEALGRKALAGALWCGPWCAHGDAWGVLDGARVYPTRSAARKAWQELYPGDRRQRISVRGVTELEESLRGRGYAFGPTLRHAVTGEAVCPRWTKPDSTAEVMR